MRLKITLVPQARPLVIPVNYNYHLSALVYRLIDLSSAEHAEWLHTYGFTLGGKRFKHFTFSRLLVPSRRIVGRDLHILSPAVEWIVSFLIERSLEHFILGLFEKQEVWIASERNRFVITSVEVLETPTFTSEMKFKTLSPIVVSGPVERSGRPTRDVRLMAYYFRPNDEGLSEALRKNTLSKYESIHGELPDDTRFEFEMDKQYVVKRGGYGRLTKLITLKEGQEDETKVKAFDAVFWLRGNPELIRLSYEAGLGEKGSLGFGCVELVKS